MMTKTGVFMALGVSKKRELWSLCSLDVHAYLKWCFGKTLQVSRTKRQSNPCNDAHRKSSSLDQIKVVCPAQAIELEERKISIDEHRHISVLLVKSLSKLLAAVILLASG
jgi:hypothetical protein